MTTSIDKSRFKNSVGGFLLKAIFYEEVNADKSSVVYTLKQDDHLGFPSLYRLYVEEGDPTEYRFAIKHLHSWAHWELLSECLWFKPLLAQWRRELDVKVRAEALLSIRAIAASEAPVAFQANKYLLDGSWKGTGSEKRGRPSKAAIQKEAYHIASQAQSEAMDLERILQRTQ